MHKSISSGETSSDFCENENPKNDLRDELQKDYHINMLERQLALAQSEVSELRAALVNLAKYRNTQADERKKLLNLIEEMTCCVANITRDEDHQGKVLSGLLKPALDSSALTRIDAANQIILKRIEGFTWQKQMVQIFRISVNGFNDDAQRQTTLTYFFKWELEYCLLLGDKPIEKRIHNKMKKFIERKKEALKLTWKEFEEGIRSGHRHAQYCEIAVEEVLKTIKECLNVSNRGIILLPEEVVKEILREALHEQKEEISGNHGQDSSLQDDVSDFDWLFQKCDSLPINFWTRANGL